MKQLVGKGPRFASGRVQPILLFVLGAGFTLLGVKTYPAFIAVGSLFMLIGYRGYTCKTSDYRKGK